MRIVNKAALALMLGILLCMIGFHSQLSSLTAARPAPPKKDHATVVLDQYKKLSHEAEVANGKYIAALEHSNSLKKEVVDAKKALGETSERLDKVKKELNVLQGHIHIFINSLYKGAHISRLFTLLLSNSPQDTLNQLSIVDLMSRDFNSQDAKIKHYSASQKILQKKYNKQIETAEKAQVVAAKALQDAHNKGLFLDLQVKRIRAEYSYLTGKQLAELRGPTYKFDRKALPPNAPVSLIAVDAAISAVGRPYVWGATGPSAFDCSGLMMWAYAQAGKNIPRTSQAQSGTGIPVSRDQLRPGDLIIIYSDASHVGMYIGDGLIIHASTFGVPVKIIPLDKAGPIAGYRRIA